MMSPFDEYLARLDREVLARPCAAPASGTEHRWPPVKGQDTWQAGRRLGADAPGIEPASERGARNRPRGVLVLRGCLPSYYLKQLAQEAVARLEGVVAVDNQIVVVPLATS